MSDELWCRLRWAAPRCSLWSLHEQGICPERKFRLFLCAGCRAFWDRLPDAGTRRAVEVAERFADGEASDDELALARREAEELGSEIHEAVRHLEETSRSAREHEEYWRLADRMHGAYGAACACAEPGAYFSTGIYADAMFEHTQLYDGYFSLHQAFTHDRPEEERCPALERLWSDLSGGMGRANPFDPSWRTSDAVALARGIYAEGAFDRMPILADALEDGGCTDRVLLIHCRGPFAHVRGCWVVDLVLGKG